MVDDDDQEVYRVETCSLCGEEGHRYRSCPTRDDHGYRYRGDDD